MVASSSRPITGPTLERDGVCGLSAMICERLVNPFCSLGSTGTRINGASTRVLVIGNTVTEPRSAK